MYSSNMKNIHPQLCTQLSVPSVINRYIGNYARD